jgi:hypothetical protein
MQVQINYIDREAFTTEEIVANARRIHGETTTVTILPESNRNKDFLYFALQNMITHQQLSLFFDNRDTYSIELQKLRADIMYLVQEVMDNVIIDNESKLTKD